MDDDSFVADDGFSDYHLFNWRRPLRASYLRTECEQFILVADYGCAVDRSEARNVVDCPADRSLPSALTPFAHVLPHQIREPRKSRHDRVQNRVHDRLAPGFSAGGYD